MSRNSSENQHPLTLLIVIGVAVYGVIALEIGLLSTVTWALMFFLLAVIVLVAVGLAYGFSRMLDDKAGTSATGRTAPAAAAAPLPKPARTARRPRQRPAPASPRPAAPMGA